METPTIGSTSYAAALNTAGLAQFNNQAAFDAVINSGLMRRMNAGVLSITPNMDDHMAEFATRLVKVFIVDSNANLPLENRLLFKGDEKITDLTDQELFFEIDINGLLAKHNEIRLKTEDKKANKDKPVYLEAARVRDLKMQVVVLAQF